MKIKWEYLIFVNIILYIYINTGSSFFAKEWQDPIIKGLDELFETMIWGGRGTLTVLKGQYMF